MTKIKIINACDKIILYSLYLIAFFLPISKAIIEFLSILAIVCFIIKKIFQGEWIAKTNFNYSVYIYLTVCLLSVFISSNFKISARTFLAKILQDILFFFTVVEVFNNERRIKFFLYILFVSAALLGIDGIYQHFTHKDFIRHRPYYGLPRIHATFPTPNDFGCYLLMVIPFTVIVSFVKGHYKLIRVFSFVLFALLFVCLVMTVSRGTWLAFLSIMLFMSIWIRFLGIFFLVLGILLIAMQQFYSPFLRTRLNNFFIFVDTSSTDRMVIWDTAWRMFMYKPFLGIGVGTFMFNFGRFVSKNYIYGVPYAHNCYLQMAAEIGLIGLISFLSILVLFFRLGIDALNQRQRTFSWYMLLAALAAILGYCVQMVVDTNFYALDLGMLFWLMLGIGFGLIRIVSTGAAN